MVLHSDLRRASGTTYTWRGREEGLGLRWLDTGGGGGGQGLRCRIDDSGLKLPCMKPGFNDCYDSGQRLLTDGNSTGENYHQGSRDAAPGSELPSSDVLIFG